VSASFISGAERGIDVPSFETLEVIAVALQVQVMDFSILTLTKAKRTDNATNLVSETN
jgi:hypothetical protein